LTQKKLAIVTGASSGLGLESVKALVAKDYKVMMVSRGEEKLVHAANEIRSQFPDSFVSEHVVDVSNLDQVRGFAGEIKQPVDLLMNNAGLMGPDFSLSIDGIESQMATNHVGHFLLTSELWGNLESATGRVIHLSSVVHRRGNFKELSTAVLAGSEKASYDRWQRYADTKLACLLFARELDLRAKQLGSRVLSIAAHPGWAITGLQKTHPHTFDSFAQDAKTGARSQILAATKPDLQGGEFVGPKYELWGEPKLILGSKRSQDLELSKGLWEKTEELIGIRFFG
jgi:NAD(P)-dependent dehydrogenase (short-subunit alcohol dehydrogenase family)